MTESVFEFIKAAREHSPSITWEYYSNGCVVSKMMVLRTEEGWYVGRYYYDVVDEKVELLTTASGPYQREKDAKKYLDNLVF